MGKVDYEISKLQKRVINGGMNRREFIKAATAMGFAALILTDSIVLREFGVVAAVNILMVFVISIIVIPIFC